MTPHTYHQSVLSTESVPAQLCIGNAELEHLLQVAVASAGVVDLMKKVLVYGRQPDFQALIAATRTLTQASSSLNSTVLVAGMKGWSYDRPGEPFQRTRINIRLLHCALGVFGESGELLEALLKQGQGEELDVINFVEELGDAGWYPQLALDELKLSEECIRTANIAKLTLVRYLKGFSGKEATFRKKDLERAAIGYVIDAYRAEPEIHSQVVLNNLQRELDAGTLMPAAAA